MPPIAQEIDPHPKSLNNITLSNLLQSSRNSSNSIEKFLCSDLSGITPAVAQRLATSLGISGAVAKSLQGKQVAALIQALRDEKQIKPPSGMNTKRAFYYFCLVYVFDMSEATVASNQTFLCYFNCNTGTSFSYFFLFPCVPCVTFVICLPVGACLSPAGEYNMRLGVLKELKPRLVATFSDKSGAHEGHPFLVEAAVSLGGTQVRMACFKV